MKAIQYLIESQLPPDIRDYDRTYDAKSMSKLQETLGEKYPDKYRDIMDNIMDISRNAVYVSGQTLRLEDFRPPFDKDAKLKEMQKEVDFYRNNIKDEAQKNKAIMEVYERYATSLEKDTINAAKEKRNKLYGSVASGARGSPFQLKAMITTPALYTDYKGRVIPYFVKHSFGEGLSIPEYLASTYGTRASTITIKKSTAKFGGLGKEGMRSVANMVISSKKDLSNNGIDLDIDDSSLYGRVLARPAAGYPEGTIVTREVLNNLQNKGVSKVIVHSPIATISPEGISAEAFGLDYNKRLPPVGSFHAGIAVNQSVMEPLIQGGLCLEENTLVRMSDYSTKPIKDIKVGDYVMASDHDGNLIPSRVLNVFDQGIMHCNRYIFRKRYSSKEFFTVDCSDNHKFLFVVNPVGNVYDSTTNTEVIPVKKALEGKAYCVSAMSSRLQGKANHSIIGILKGYEYIGKKRCFDIEVEYDSHLFLLANGLISHNSSKHEAGGFKGKKRTFSGFNYINQFFQSPEHYKSRAPLAESDGKVEKIVDAPQGGKYVIINGVEHYVDPDSNINVKVGQDVEQGDQLSDGMVDLEDVVRLRGIGEGRRTFVDVGKQLFDDSGTPAHKRNLEVLARGIVDKVEITDPEGLGDYLPGDVVSYNVLEASYVPKPNSERISVKDNKNLKGKYLQKPVLHYTIGTKLTNKMIDHIRDSGITDNVLVSTDEPGFSPVYIRLRDIPNKGNRNFLERASAPYQARNFVESAVRGNKTNIKENVDPFVRLTFTDFANDTQDHGRF